jgi:hypothetical protein
MRTGVRCKRFAIPMQFMRLHTAEQEYRCRCLRRWYNTRGVLTERSQQRNRLLRITRMSRQVFYNLLSGRTLLTNDRVEEINRAVNMDCLFDIDIFTQEIEKQ